MNNSKKKTNLFVDLFILRYLLFSLFGPPTTKKLYIYIWLFVWVLWHINLSRFFNGKPIFIQINFFYLKQFN